MLELRTNPGLVLSLVLLLLCAGCAQSAMMARGGGEDAPSYSGDDPFGDGSSDDDDDEGGDDDDSGPSSAPPQIVELTPAAGSLLHHYRHPIQVVFDSYAGSCTLTLFDQEGVSVPVQTEWDADYHVLTAHPSVWLQPSSSYSVSVGIGDATLDYSFSTTDLGEPLADPSLVDGVTFALAFDEATSSSSVVAQALSELSYGAWLWSFTLPETGELEVSTALGQQELPSGTVDQDMCGPTRPLGSLEMEFQNPYFGSPVGDFELMLDDWVLSFEQGGFEGDFNSTGVRFETGQFNGYLRADSLVPLVGSEACEWVLQEFGSVCETCPSGDGNCAWLEVSGITGHSLALDLDEVDGDSLPIDCDDQISRALPSCSYQARPGRAPLALLLGLLLLGRQRQRRS